MALIIIDDIVLNRIDQISVCRHTLWCTHNTVVYMLVLVVYAGVDIGVCKCTLLCAWFTQAYTVVYTVEYSFMYAGVHSGVCIGVRNDE